MDVDIRNNLLLQGKLDVAGIFPHLEASQDQPVRFEVDFGLAKLPLEPGLILIRGARQMGKSTWLESTLKASVEDLGAGSSFYLNGDYLRSAEDLYRAIVDLHPAYTNPIKRLFIDEITAIPNWENAIKRAYDEGVTRKTLIITTGSQAIDLRRGSERLPGRKGRLKRTTFRFLPLSFGQFENRCRETFGHHTFEAYQLSGGSPIAANEILKNGGLPPFVMELTRDWILGECNRQGRSSNLLSFLLQDLHRKAQVPVSLTNLAKEVGAANNTVLQGYIDLLKDLLVVAACHNVDLNTRRPLPRKSAKFHSINLLSAIAFDPDSPWTLAEFSNQAPPKKAKWLEWTVASHLWRKKALAGEQDPESLAYWSNGENEIDFLFEEEMIEVKLAPPSIQEMAWARRVFPGKNINIIHRGNIEEFLRS